MLKDLKKIEFHDIGLIELNINFSQLKIEMMIEIEFDKSTFLTFEQISLLSIKELKNLEKFYYVEIYDAEFGKVDNNYMAKFIFLLGPGMPNWELEFSFKTVKIVPRITAT